MKLFRAKIFSAQLFLNYLPRPAAVKIKPNEITSTPDSRLPHMIWLPIGKPKTNGDSTNQIPTSTFIQAMIFIKKFSSTYILLENEVGGKG